MNRTLIIVALVAVAAGLLVYGVFGRQRSVLVTSASRGGSVNDPPAPALTVRTLDVGQGDATYIHNGDSRVLVDGGPDAERMGVLLDSLHLNGTTIDVVVLTHQHYDHYNGLLDLFDSHRNIKVRYFFEDKDPSTASTLARLRDSVLARVDRDSLIYRDTDDPCGDGRPLCTITLRGGARLHLMQPLPQPEKPNNRSAAIKLVGPDSASFTMWLAGDAEHDEIGYFDEAGYNVNPGMGSDVLKADHHGSCNGVTPRYLQLIHPSWVVVSVAAHNDYGHMHAQAKAEYRAAGIPWYRTDQNGTITIRSPGTPGSGYTVTPSRPGEDLSGPSDRASRQGACN
ncbi:MAG: ComEC/Rec2 family competence protein [Gemmatimonadaceae bacterium]